jgi:Tol biopolymer transport system component
VERRGGHYSLAQVPIEGGEPLPITTQFPNTVLLDISPDHSALLILSLIGGDEQGALWILPTSGGSPRRLGEVTAHDAAWSHDGQSIVYSSGSALYLVRPDGSESRRLVSTTGLADYPRWSLDGRLIRFTLSDLPWHTESIWEVTAKGTNLHRLLAGWREASTNWGDGESGGDWTPDGKYFIYRSVRARTASIWAIREKRDLLHWRSSAPMLLTTSDLYLWNISVARNSKRVLFGASRDERELQRYDSRSKHFLPYLAGVSARWLSFSRDGQWVAYVTTPGFVLWRSRVDGSDRLQLTFPPLGASRPGWSPSGKGIAFAGDARVHILSSDGGNPEAVTPEQYRADDPEWSPEGNSLLFSAHPAGGGGNTWAIYRLDLKTRQVSQLPGSEGLRAPAFSPDGKYVAAISTDPTNRLMLLSAQSQHWTELARGDSLFTPYWSRDGNYVYSQDLAGVEQPVFRVRISDHKSEVITTLKQFPRADATAYSLAGLTPEGEPLASLLRSSGDIYALDVDFP